MYAVSMNQSFVPSKSLQRPPGLCGRLGAPWALPAYRGAPARPLPRTAHPHRLPFTTTALASASCKTASSLASVEEQEHGRLVASAGGYAAHVSRRRDSTLTRRLPGGAVQMGLLPMGLSRGWRGHWRGSGRARMPGRRAASPRPAPPPAPPRPWGSPATRQGERGRASASAPEVPSPARPCLRRRVVCGDAACAARRLETWGPCWRRALDRGPDTAGRGSRHAQGPSLGDAQGKRAAAVLVSRASRRIAARLTRRRPFTVALNRPAARVRVRVVSPTLQSPLPPHTAGTHLAARLSGPGKHACVQQRGREGRRGRWGWGRGGQREGGVRDLR